MRTALSTGQATLGRSPMNHPKTSRAHAALLAALVILVPRPGAAQSPRRFPILWGAS